MANIAMNVENNQKGKIMAMHKDKKKPMHKKHKGMEIEIEVEHKEKKKKKEPAKKHKMMNKEEKKIKKVMHEFGEGKLHSGSKKRTKGNQSKAGHCNWL